jgi:hypothetical protein
VKLPPEFSDRLAVVIETMLAFGARDHVAQKTEQTGVLL